MISASASLQAMRFALGFSFAVSLSVGVSAQTADQQQLSEYTSILRQIEDVHLTLGQKQAQVKFQENEIERLTSEIDELPDLKAQIEPMLDVMVANIQEQQKYDLPFNAREREARFESLKSIMASEKASLGEKFRRAYEVYGIEAEYGTSVEAYGGFSPFIDKQGYRYEICIANETSYKSKECSLDDDQLKELESGEKQIYQIQDEIFDGDYLRVGRLALAYMEYDGSAVYRYDPKTTKWEELSGNDFLDVRRAIRIAKGEVAPGVLGVPVYVR